MTDPLAAIPPTRTPSDVAPTSNCTSVARELTRVAQAAHARANTLHASGHRGVELAVVELRAFGDRVLRHAAECCHDERPGACHRTTREPSPQGTRYNVRK